MNFFEQALKVLPDVAVHPLAFAGYALVIGAWLIAYLRTRRFKLLIQRIEQLPEPDRKPAIQLEFNTVLPSAINAEQWLRGQRQKYYLIAFVVTMVSLLTVFIFLYGSDEFRIRVPAEPSGESPRFHVSLGSAINAVNKLNSSSAISLEYFVYNLPSIPPGGTFAISSCDLVQQLTLTNLQSGPTDIEGFGLETASNSNGPWTTLCPLSSAGANAFFGYLTHARQMDIWSDLLEPKIIGQKLAPNIGVTGVTYWECPHPNCVSKFFRLNIREASGKLTHIVVTNDNQSLEVAQGMLMRATGPMVNLLSEGRHFRIWNQCQAQ